MSSSANVVTSWRRPIRLPAPTVLYRIQRLKQVNECMSNNWYILTAGLFIIGTLVVFNTLLKKSAIYRFVYFHKHYNLF